MRGHAHLENRRPGSELLIHLHERAGVGGFFLPNGEGRPIRDVRSGRARSDDQLGRGELFVRRAHGASRDAELGCQVLPGWQTSSRGEHAALDGGPDTFADLLGQRRLRRSIKLQPQRLGHTFLVHDFCAFLVLFCGPRYEHLLMQRRTPMKIPFIFGAACAAIAIAAAMPAAAHGIGETVTPHFEQAITNIPGSHWSPWSLTMRRAERRLRTSTPNRPLSSATSCLAKLNRR